MDAWLDSERLGAVIGVPSSFCDGWRADALRIQTRLFPMAATASATWTLREWLHTFAALDLR